MTARCLPANERNERPSFCSFDPKSSPFSSFQTGSYWLEGRQLRSNFGTTKYCATYLRNSPCSNPDCLYLHELGDEEDRFTKEEIQQRSLLAPPIPPGAVTVTGGGGPSGTGMRCNSPYLPPPVYQASENGAGSREGGSGRMVRSLSQGQQGAAASGGATTVQRAAARGAKPAGQVTCCAVHSLLPLVLPFTGWSLLVCARTSPVIPDHKWNNSHVIIFFFVVYLPG